MNRKVFHLGTTPPVVGLSYWVPCVEQFTFRGNTVWVPVLGPATSDPEIDNPNLHMHLDYRFMSEKYYRNVVRREMDSRVISVVRFDLPPKVCLRAKKCHRSHQPIRCPDSRTTFIDKLERLMAGKKVIKQGDCFYCPHKKFPLHDAARLQGTIVECPGHTLAWNLDTGELVTAKELGRS